MAQQKVVDLVVQHGSVQIVQRGPGPAVAPVPAGELHTSLARIATPWPLLVLLGLGLGAFGLLAFAAVSSLSGVILANALVSGGACLAVLGALKRWSTAVRPAAALPAPRVDPRVLAERCRRVRAILRRGGGEYTFERLVGESKWTQAAMLSTLLHMKEQGEIVEDLNLDTGEWVYTLAEGIDVPTRAPTSPMLEEREAVRASTERHG